VSDLTDEMRQFAADGATYARPLAVADVIHRGNRRRTRTIAQRSIGGLSAVGLGAAVLFTGVTHHLASNPAASGAAASGDSMTVTRSTAAGTISMRIKYRTLPNKTIKLESLTYSGYSKRAVKNVVISFLFGPGLNPNRPEGTLDFSNSMQLSQSHHFSGSMPANFLSSANNSGKFLPVNGSARIELQAARKIGWQPPHKRTDTKTDTSKVQPTLTAGVILSS